MKTSTYEQKIIDILRKDNIKFIREKTFKDLKNGMFRFDFYISSLSSIIEVDGEYHFKPIKGRKELLKQQEHDRLKNSYCLANNIKLYRIPYWELDNINSSEDIFKSEFLVKNKWHNDELKN